MHPSAAVLPLIGGHPALDLVNTVEPRVPLPGAAPHDHLLDPAALLDWAPRAGLVEPAEVDRIGAAWAGEQPAGWQALAAVREVRETLHTVLLAAGAAGTAGGPVAEAALARLHQRWAAAAGRSALVLDPSRTGVVRLAVGSAPGPLLPDRAAVAAVDVLLTADPGRLRTCPVERGGCGWVFLDRSRNGSRRWCQMADCGSRVKARRLTARRQAARAAAADGPAAG